MIGFALDLLCSTWLGKPDIRQPEGALTVSVQLHTIAASNGCHASSYCERTGLKMQMIMVCVLNKGEADIGAN